MKAYFTLKWAFISVFIKYSFEVHYKRTSFSTTSASDPLHVHKAVWSCVWHYERCLLCVYEEFLCLIGIVGDVILLYNNEEKETSAGHENKTKS